MPSLARSRPADRIRLRSVTPRRADNRVSSEPSVNKKPAATIRYYRHATGTVLGQSRSCGQSIGEVPPNSSRCGGFLAACGLAAHLTGGRWGRGGRPADSKNRQKESAKNRVGPLSVLISGSLILCRTSSAAAFRRAKNRRNIVLHDWRSYIVSGKLEKHWRLRRLYNSVKLR